MGTPLGKGVGASCGLMNMEISMVSSDLVGAANARTTSAAARRAAVMAIAARFESMMRRKEANYRSRLSVAISSECQRWKSACSKAF